MLEIYKTFSKCVFIISICGFLILQRHQLQLIYSSIQSGNYSWNVFENFTNTTTIGPIFVSPNKDDKPLVPCIKALGVSKCGLLTAWGGGQLGNQLFWYASLYGLAKKLNRTPFLISKGFQKLNDAFDNIKIPTCLGDWPDLKYKATAPTNAAIFDQTLISEKLPCGTNFKLDGFLQSWKYFDEQFDDIIKQLRFRNNISVECDNIINDIIIKNNGQKCQLVGIHARRGDFVSRTGYGYVPANSDYIRRAIEYMKNKLERDDSKCLLFLMVGDDHTWNIANAPNHTNVHVLPKRSAEVDFCILTRCNHTIMTVGTFGLWAAYITKGITIYQKEFARKGSRLSTLTNEKDFYTPDMIGL